MEGGFPRRVPPAPLSTLTCPYVDPGLWALGMGVGGVASPELGRRPSAGLAALGEAAKLAALAVGPKAKLVAKRCHPPSRKELDHCLDPWLRTRMESVST